MSKIISENIDGGKAFDWGETSKDYARYRDIYPPEFYAKLLELGLCTAGQTVLDLGTGTGVLPRCLYSQGARFVGADIAANQIAEARRLSKEQGMEIEYLVSPAEQVDFPENTFDTVTAAQCFWYFDTAVLLPRLYRMLKPGGRLAELFMAWVPEDSEIAAASEELVLRYSPTWTGGHYRRTPPVPADWAGELFETEHLVAFDVDVPFTRESWNGRMRACRGVGASLSEERVRAFSEEHLRLLERIAPKEFTIPHYVTMRVHRSKKK